MNKLLQYCGLVLLMIIIQHPLFAQNEKLVGLWKIIDLKTDDYPTGMVSGIYEMGLKRLKAKYDSTGERLDANDSAKVKDIAQQSFIKAADNPYIQLSQDGIAVISLGKNTKMTGNYRPEEDNQCLVIRFDKNQKTEDDLIKLGRKRKLQFCYSFHAGGIVRLENEDGSIIFWLEKE